MLLIDTYNVLHVTGVLPTRLAGVGPLGLLRLVRGSRLARAGAHLVCDGPNRIEDADACEGDVRLVFAGAGRDADSLIERSLEQSSAPRRITVVSSDRRLRQAARKRRARWLSSEAFLRRLGAELDDPRPGAAPAKPDVPLTPREVDHWLRHFGLHDLAGAARAGRPPDPSHGTGQPPGPSEPIQPRDEPERLEPDPLIEEALREWSGRLAEDDLDMSQWLDPPESDGRSP